MKNSITRYISSSVIKGVTLIILLNFLASCTSSSSIGESSQVTVDNTSTQVHLILIRKGNCFIKSDKKPKEYDGELLYEKGATYFMGKNKDLPTEYGDISCSIQKGDTLESFIKREYEVKDFLNIPSLSEIVINHEKNNSIKEELKKSLTNGSTLEKDMVITLPHFY